MAVSTELARVYTSAPMDDRVLDTLEIRHPNFTVQGHSYFVTNSDQAFEATLENGARAGFQVFPFTIQLPSSGEDGFQDMTISISNISRVLVEEVERAQTSPDIPIEFVFRAFAESTLNKVGWQLPPLSASEIIVEPEVISARASMSDLVNRNFPHRLYTTQLFPMLGNVS